MFQLSPNNCIGIKRQASSCRETDFTDLAIDVTKRSHTSQSDKGAKNIVSPKDFLTGFCDRIIPPNGRLFRSCFMHTKQAFENLILALFPVDPLSPNFRKNVGTDLDCAHRIPCSDINISEQF